MNEEKAHILVVDDDRRLRSLLQRFLRESGFVVSVAKDAFEARERLMQYKFSLLVVDVMMPEETGLEFVEKLRQSSDVPVIMLTAMGDIDNRIDGLEKGADDYIGKPFEPKELILRIKNILKRATKNITEKPQKIMLGDCTFDLTSKTLVKQSGDVIHITPVEQSLMMLLGEKTGQVFSRDKLADILGAGQSPRSIDVQITRLRKKIENDSKNPRYLQTVRGCGYMLISDK